jgi:hypothetical protein
MQTDPLEYSPVECIRAGVIERSTLCRLKQSQYMLMNTSYNTPAPHRPTIVRAHEGGRVVAHWLPCVVLLVETMPVH